MIGNFSPWGWDDDPFRRQKRRGPAGDGSSHLPWLGHFGSTYGSSPLPAFDLQAQTAADFCKQLRMLLALKLGPVQLADAEVASWSETAPKDALKPLTEVAQDNWGRQGDRVFALAFAKDAYRRSSSTSRRLGRKHAAAASQLERTPRWLKSSQPGPLADKARKSRRLAAGGWYAVIAAFLANEFANAANLGEASALAFLSSWPAAASFAAAFVLPAGLWLKVDYSHRDATKRTALRKRLFPVALAASVLGGCCYAWILSGRAAANVSTFAAAAQPTSSIQLLSALAFLLQIAAVSAAVILATDANDKLEVTVESENQQFPRAEREERESFVELSEWESVTVLAEELYRRLKADRSSHVAATIAAHRSAYDAEDARDEVAEEGDKLRRAKRRLRRRTSN